MFLRIFGKFKEDVFIFFMFDKFNEVSDCNWIDGGVCFLFVCFDYCWVLCSQGLGELWVVLGVDWVCGWGQMLEMLEKKEKVLQKKIVMEIEKVKEFFWVKNKRGEQLGFVLVYVLLLGFGDVFFQGFRDLWNCDVLGLLMSVVV